MKEFESILRSAANVKQLNRIEEIVNWELVKNSVFQEFKEKFEKKYSEISEDLNILLQSLSKFKNDTAESQKSFKTELELDKEFIKSHESKIDDIYISSNKNMNEI